MSTAPLTSTLRTLRLATALLGVYGAPDDFNWVNDKVTEILADSRPVPTIDGLALAARVNALCGYEHRDEIVRQLWKSAVADMSSLEDLDALEAYAETLEQPLATASVFAREIINAELTHLADESDPQTIRYGAQTLMSRAAIYGQAIEISALLDRADELSFIDDA